jgi:hypothetical protein
MGITLLPCSGLLWMDPFELPVLTPTVLLKAPLHEPVRKHRFQQYIYCCMRIRCRGEVFTEPLPRNDSTRYNILGYNGMQSVGSQPTILEYTSSPSSVLKNKPSIKTCSKQSYWRRNIRHDDEHVGTSQETVILVVKAMTVRIRSDVVTTVSINVMQRGLKCLDKLLTCNIVHNSAMY